MLVMPATVASAQSADAESAEVSIERYGGADRYETSLRIAEAFVKGAGGTVEDVVLVSGRHWTDAVVAASFASRLGAPVLMTPPGELRDDALTFLKKVSVEKVHIVAAGGNARHACVAAGVDSASRSRLRDILGRR